MQKAQYLAFMAAKPSQPLVQDHWLKWWDSRQMSGSSDLVRNISAWDGASNQDLVDGWLAAEETLAFSRFDEASNTWEFGIILCTENYFDLLPLLVFCESVSAYKLFSPQDFSIVYPYFWGDSHVMAYMTFPENSAVLSLAQSVADVDRDHLDYAESRLDQRWQEYQAK